jgi:hypothetical protein
MKRFEKVKIILEEAVEGTTIAAHGNFWRNLTLEQFKVKKVFGRQLVLVGNAVESNLIKALEGRTPFGADTGVPGAIFNRMPDGFPAVSPEEINYIKDWIDDGCPDDGDAQSVESSEQKLISYNAYWRDFDDWAAFHRTPEIDAAIGEVFSYAEIWMAVAMGQTPLSAWQEAISLPAAREATTLLKGRILETINIHLGTPADIDRLLESYELFGANKLPDDPLRPQDPRHNMNGWIMWFFYSAFLDAGLAASVSPEKEELQTLGRAILIGLLNDGLFRGRFPVKGFTPDDRGASAVRQFVRTIAAADIQAELVQRFVDSQA